MANPTDTGEVLQEEAAEKHKKTSSRARFLPQNYVKEHGLPLTPGPRTAFPKFMEYWRKLTPAQRSNVLIYVYALFPILKFPDEEHFIAKLPGEKPWGGENGLAEEDALTALGLGDFYLQMKYKEKAILTTWLMGYTENLPGFRDFTNHPPLYVRDMKYVVLDDEKNIKSGYIMYLKGKGLLPSDAGSTTIQTKGNEESMAEAQAQTSAVGTLGRIAERVILDNSKTPPPAAPPNRPEWETIQETIRTVNDIHKNNAVDPVALITTTAELLKRDPPKAPDFSPFLTQIESLNARVSDMQTKAMDNMREDLKATRETLNAVVTQARTAATTATTEVAVRKEPLDELIESVDKISRLKTALGFKSEDDDAPRRRRYDEEENPEPKESIWEKLASNLPTILTTGMALAQMVAIAIHNAQVVRTGEGTTVAPPGAPNIPSSPAPGSNLPAVTNPPNPQGDQMALQNEAAAFFKQLEPGIIGALERGETGYEYAETFIKSMGRSGPFGYQALKQAGGSPKETCQAISNYMAALAPTLWNKLKADPRIEDFLMQFVTYDEFLKEEGCPNLTKLLVESGFETVTDYINAPDNEDDENNTPDDDAVDINVDGTIKKPPTPTTKAS